MPEHAVPRSASVPVQMPHLYLHLTWAQLATVGGRFGTLASVQTRLRHAGLRKLASAEKIVPKRTRCLSG